MREGKRERDRNVKRKEIKSTHTYVEKEVKINEEKMVDKKIRSHTQEILL